MICAKKYESVSKFVKVTPRILRPLFSETVYICLHLDIITFNWQWPSCTDSSCVYCYHLTRLCAFEIQEKPVTSYDSDEPKKDRPTYQPSDHSYNSPPDPYSATYDNSAGSSYHAAPSYPPQNSYQPPDHSSSSQSSYVVGQPYESYSTSVASSYHSPPYPPKHDSYSSEDSYKPPPPQNPYPTRDVYASSDSDQYYKPSPSYYAYPAKPTSYEETDASYHSKDGH